MEVISKFSDVIKEIWSCKKYKKENRSIIDSTIYTFSHECDFDLVVVRKGTINYHSIYFLKCIGVQVSYYGNGSSIISLKYAGKVDKQYSIQLDPRITEIGCDDKVIDTGGLYISDNIIYIKKYLSEILRKLVDKKLNEIAALYNEYNINKL